MVHTQITLSMTILEDIRMQFEGLQYSADFLRILRVQESSSLRATPLPGSSVPCNIYNFNILKLYKILVTLCMLVKCQCLIRLPNPGSLPSAIHKMQTKF